MFNSDLFWRKILIFDRLFEKNRILFSVRQGLTLVIPLLFVGSFAILVTSFPVQSYQLFMNRFFGSEWLYLGLTLKEASFGILAVLILLSISYIYSAEKSGARSDGNNPFISAIVSFSSLLALTGTGENIFRNVFGVTGVFIAIVASVFSSVIFDRLCSYKIFTIRVYSDGSNTAFNDAVKSVIPAFITISFFAVIRYFLLSVAGISDIYSFISVMTSGLFSGTASSIGNAFLFIFLIHILWFFGIHGSNMLEPAALSIFVPALTRNIAQVNQGLPPTEIFTKTFFDSFVLTGGCGSIICLVIAILLFGKHKNMKRLARLSIIPVIFNINELIIFGIPVVLDPIFFFPFISIPLFFTLTSFIAINAGLVPHTIYAVQWTTPVLLSGYLSTGSAAGSILQLFNITIGIFICIPFIRLAEKRNLSRMTNYIQQTCDYIERPVSNRELMLLNRSDNIGIVSRTLTTELQYDLAAGNMQLMYQPQVDIDGKVYGVESLLRWNHPLYGYINPVIAVSLAEESGMADRLGLWIIDKSCSDLKLLHEHNFENIIMSINVSAIQLENIQFVPNLESIVRKHGIHSSSVKIEITERLAISGSRKVAQRLREIKESGFLLAMDDFGMGHSSLMYLKEYDFDTIKIDGSLVKDLHTSPACRDIISSIVYLSRSINFMVIAEYVETEALMTELSKLGCSIFQGYYYSPALTVPQLIDFLNNPKPAGKKLYGSF